MRLTHVGEFGLVKRILGYRALKRRTPASWVTGPGDDAFAWSVRPGNVLIVTKDLLIERVHFKRMWSTPEQIGRKALAVNLSDIAAMGGSNPIYAFIGLGLPDGTDVSFVDRLYRGMNSLAKRSGTRITGGDVVSSKEDIVISVTLAGETRRDRVIGRSGARPGDVICVTGTFGDAAAGLYLLRKGLRVPRYLITRQLTPTPRLREAEKLSSLHCVTGMTDSSDGLAAAVRFICEASGTGAKIDLERIPFSKQMKALAGKHRRIDPVSFALNGGEDYELVFTVRPKDIPAIQRALPGVSCVGTIGRHKGVRYYLHDKPQNIKGQGSQFFAP